MHVPLLRVGSVYGSGRREIRARALACSGDLLLQALVACAGVTLSAVATSLGVAKDAPVGFRQIRLSVHLETDASAEERAKLLELTERYCVVFQTIARGAEVCVAMR